MFSLIRLSIFFERLEHFAGDFVPTEDDLLRTRIRTIGIKEMKIRMGDDEEFTFIDVGGQRSERKKWIHCFEDIQALMFIVAISDYNLLSPDDHTTNRLVEAVQLFHETIALEWFINTSIILFLNKSDLFYDKLDYVKLSTYFPNYSGNNRDEAIKFIRSCFIAKENLKGNSQRNIYSHITRATDSQQVSAVIASVEDIVLSANLASSSLM